MSRMPLIEYEIVTADIVMNQVFHRPIFDWERAARKFFATVYDAISPKYPISARELSLSQSIVLSDVSSRYSIFGGNSSVYLNPDKVGANFVGIQSRDIETAMDIQTAVQERFDSEFPECMVRSVEYRWVGHVRLRDRAVGDYLATFAPQLSGRPEITDFAYKPGIRFRLSRAQPTAEFELTAERSLAFDDALFISRAISLGLPDGPGTFAKRLALLVEFDEIGLRCANLTSSRT